MICMIYLNLHWQLALDSAAVGEIITFARPLHKPNGIHNGNYGMHAKNYYNKSQKIYHIFFDTCLDNLFNIVVMFNKYNT